MKYHHNNFTIALSVMTSFNVCIVMQVPNLWTIAKYTAIDKGDYNWRVLCYGIWKQVAETKYDARINW